MEYKKVIITVTESEDWEELAVEEHYTDGRVTSKIIYENHMVPNEVWIQLIKELLETYCIECVYEVNLVWKE